MKQELLTRCNERFTAMNIWHIIDNFEQLKVIRGIIRCYINGENLSKRQTVRLVDFSLGLSIYKVYSKKSIQERYEEIKNLV